MAGSSVLVERRIVFNAVPLKVAVCVAIAITMMVTALILYFSVGHAHVFTLWANAIQALLCVGVIVGVVLGDHRPLFGYILFTHIIATINFYDTFPATVGANQTWISSSRYEDVKESEAKEAWHRIHIANAEINQRVVYYSFILACVENAYVITTAACWWVVVFGYTKMKNFEIDPSRSPCIQRLTRLSHRIGTIVGGPYASALSDKRVITNRVPLLLVLTIIISVEMFIGSMAGLAMLLRGSKLGFSSELLQLLVCASVIYAVRKGKAWALWIYLIFNFFEAIHMQLMEFPTVSNSLVWVWELDWKSGTPLNVANANLYREIRLHFRVLAITEIIYLTVVGCAWLVVFLTYKTIKTTPLPNYESHINAVFMSDGLDGPKGDVSVGNEQGNRAASASSSADESTTTTEDASPIVVEIGTSSKAKLVDAMVV